MLQVYRVGGGGGGVVGVGLGVGLGLAVPVRVGVGLGVGEGGGGGTTEQTGNAIWAADVSRLRMPESPSGTDTVTVTLPVTEKE
jgi:hypothetical protein